MYDSNNITKKDIMNLLINKSKSLNIKFNNDSNITQNERILIDDLDINRMNTYIDQFVMVENMSGIKIKEIVNDNIKKLKKSRPMI